MLMCFEFGCGVSGIRTFTPPLFLVIRGAFTSAPRVTFTARYYLALTAAARASARFKFAAARLTLALAFTALRAVNSVVISAVNSALFSALPLAVTAPGVTL